MRVVPRPGDADERVLRFRPHLAVARVEGVVMLVGERERYVLSGSSAALLAELLDGRRPVRELVQAARGRAEPATLLAALAELEGRGLVAPLDPALPAAGAAFCSALGVDAGRRPRVSLWTAPRLAELTSALVDALSGAELELDAEAELAVVVADDVLAADVQRQLAECREAGRDAFLIQPSGAVGFVGPLLAADRGPCSGCLAHALERQRPVERWLAAHGAPGVRPPAAWLPASVRALAGLAAVRLRRLLEPDLGPHPLSRRELVSFDFASFRTESQPVRKRPQCAVCGDPTGMARVGDTRVELRARPRSFVAEGGYRAASPAETYERLAPLVGRVLGPVTHVDPMPRRNAPGRPVFSSGYLACPVDGVPRGNVFDKNCAGKGRSVEQARASALCEALERYAGVYQGDEAVVRRSFDDLAPDALSPDVLQLFSEAQLRAGGGDDTPGLRVPRRFERGAVLDWTPAWSLTDGRRGYVPLAFCYSHAPASTGTAYSVPSSNGCAAGNCLEEAILQGVLELVERDAAAIWWYNRLRRPALALAALRDPWVDALVDDYRRLGFTVWALDLTHDLEIPVVVAVACEAATQRFALGFGCHLDFALAAQRALTELNQVFDPDGTTPSPWDGLSAAREAYVRPSADLPARSPADHPGSAGTDLRTDVEGCVARLTRAGLDTWVVNKSRPDLELAVVQVIVPGLRHVWPRFAPGRLYDVPVALGLADRARTEAELNPRPLLV